MLYEANLKPSPITYYIVESDENTIRLIQREIKTFGDDFKSLGIYRCYKEAHKRILREEPNMVFLNIEFPFFTGGEIFGKTPGKKSDFIFLANVDNFIYQNIKASKYDCLLKPISEIELKRTLKRKVEAKKMDRQLTYGHYSPASTDYKFKKLQFPTSNGFIFLSPDEIVYCKADVEYTLIVTQKGNHLISKNLKHFEGMLNSRRFLRAHKSYLVNIDHIRIYAKSEGGHLIMSDDKMVPIGRSKKPVISQIFGV